MTRNHEVDACANGTEERYADLIAFPEGGRDYADEVLSAAELSEVWRMNAAALASHFERRDRPVPQEVCDYMEVYTVRDFTQVQRSMRIRWGDIGEVLAKWQYDVIEKYALFAPQDAATSSDDPGAS